ncbi:FHA domain-containing protein [Myxococcaceae bacterium GXIMD 01537]
MSNGSPPARRRPPSGSAESGPRPARKAPSAPPPEPEGSSGDGPKLVCTAGPKAGEEFLLSEEEYVIGRATDNGISIPDSSVSRKHVQVRKLGAGWVASDLGSGNGTLLNGEPLADEAVLKDGDVITMGDSELQFVAGSAPNPDATMMMPAGGLANKSDATMMIPMPTARPARPAAAEAPARPARGAAPAARPERGAPAAAARPERAPRLARGGGRETGEPVNANKKRVVLLAVGVLVVAGVGLAILKSQANAVQEAERQAEIANAQEIEVLRSRFQECKNLVREGRWKEAKEKLAALNAEAPNPDVQTYLDRATKEIPNEENLKAAKESIDKKELAAARAALSKVTEDTQMYELRRQVLTGLQEAADARSREARLMLDAKRLDEAKVVADDVLAAFPENRDAKIISEEAGRLIYIRNNPAAPPPPNPGKPWESAVARFSDGDMSGAVALANACVGKAPRCRQLIDQMTEFGNLYKRVEDLDAKGLTRLLNLDRDITDGRGSKMARSAGTRAANIFYKNATAAKAAGQFGRAVENAKRALQADPSHAGAKNIMEELKGRAKDVYLSAYSIKDTSPDEALAKFKDVVAMTAADDEYNQKAKTWIEKLSR